MSKHEIRLRRQKLTGRGTERFRNYGAVLRRHEEEMRLKKILRVFTLFLVILIVVILLVIVMRVEKKVTTVPKSTSGQIYSPRYFRTAGIEAPAPGEPQFIPRNSVKVLAN